MAVHHSEFLAAGYFLLQATGRDEMRSPDLLPDRLLSLSTCICPSVHVYWGWDEDEAQRQFGFPIERWSELAAWESDRLEWPNVFHSLAHARDFCRMFDLTHEHLHLIGVGLPKTLYPAFANRRAPLQSYNPVTDEYVDQADGIQTMLQQQDLLATGGEMLGFEVVSYYSGLSHSWLCASLENTMHTKFNIRPNSHGLIATYEQAMQVYEWIAADEQKGHRAEPEPYFPWLIIDYPLETVDDEA